MKTAGIYESIVFDPRNQSTNNPHLQYLFKSVLQSLLRDIWESIRVKDEWANAQRSPLVTVTVLWSHSTSKRSTSMHSCKVQYHTTRDNNDKEISFSHSDHFGVK